MNDGGNKNEIIIESVVIGYTILLLTLSTYSKWYQMDRKSMSSFIAKVKFIFQPYIFPSY